MNLRMIADGRRHESDLIGDLAHSGRASKQFFRRKNPRREIRIPCPAESTTHRAAARYLDQIAAAHFGVIGNDFACRDEVVIKPAIALLLAHGITHGEDATRRPILGHSLAYFSML